MNIRVLASVAFALMGFLSLFKSIVSLQSLAAIPAMADYYHGNVLLLTLGYATAAVALIGFGVTLIARRDRLARWLVPDDAVIDGVDSSSCAELAFTILGLYLFITALPWVASLAVDVIDYLIVGQSDDLQRRVRIDPGRLLGYLAQFGAGAFLFLCPKWVGAWWRRRAATD